MTAPLQVEDGKADQPRREHEEHQVDSHALRHAHLPEVQRVLQQELQGNHADAHHHQPARKVVLPSHLLQAARCQVDGQHRGQQHSSEL